MPGFINGLLDINCFTNINPWKKFMYKCKHLLLHEIRKLVDILEPNEQKLQYVLTTPADLTVCN